MAGYIPDTHEDRNRMLSALGMESMEELLSPIPAPVRLDRPLRIPGGVSEMETRAHVLELTGLNKRFDAVFRGAGAYRHAIPAVVSSLAAREEFVTAYTPYQAEISQGVLQAIFEYQDLIM